MKGVTRKPVSMAELYDTKEQHFLKGLQFFNKNICTAVALLCDHTQSYELMLITFMVVMRINVCNTCNNFL